MNFEADYEKFMRQHSEGRKNQRLEQLLTSHGHAEKRFLQNVWWPAFRHFNGLHPEYEIHDYKDGYRYIDFAYIQAHFRVAIEIDGLGPHWRNISKWQFSNHCQRQNHLVIDGWHILRFTYDDVDEFPRVCQQTLHQLLGRLLGGVSAAMSSLSLVEREVIRLAMTAAHAITAKHVTSLLHVSPDCATRCLRKLSDNSWLQPASGSVRIRSYRLHPSRNNIQL